MHAPTFSPSIASVNDLRTLLQMRDGPFVSVYSSPNTFAQTLTNALHTLRRRNGRRDDAFSHIARRLRSESIDAHRSLTAELSFPVGTACFVTPTQSVLLALPIPVPAQVVLGEAPFLGPLLTLFHPSYIVGLYLSQQGAHAIQRFGEWQAHRPLDVLPPGDDMRSRQSTMASKGFVLHWLQAVDRGLDPLLPCRHHPVVLIGPPDLIDAYASVNVHRSVISGGSLLMAPCPDVNVLLDVITATAQDNAQSHITGDLRVLEETRSGAPKRYLDDAHKILEEAAARRVDTLFVRRTRRRSTPSVAFAGTSADAQSPSSDEVHGPAPYVDVALPDLDERIEAAMAHTIVSGGTVHEVTDAQHSANAPMTAVLRY